MAEITLTATIEAFRPGSESDEYDVVVTHDRPEQAGLYPRTIVVGAGDDPSDAIREVAEGIRSAIAADEAETGASRSSVVPLGGFDLGG